MMRLTTAAALLLASGFSLAQDVTRCTPMQDDTDRLHCYDSASGRTAPNSGAVHEVGPQDLARLSRWERRLIEDAVREPYTPTAYQPSYALFTYVSDINRAPYRSVEPQEKFRNEEVKFNLSMQVKLGENLFRTNGDLWFGYTQTAYWQFFSQDISSPLRETVHEPEVHLSFLTDFPFFGLTGRSVGFGVVHESNGRGEPLSRSWNRVVAELQFARGDFGLSVKPWVRIKEEIGKDDNPDIESYLGHYEVRASWERRDHLFGLMLRNVLNDNRRYNSELSWSFPIAGRLRALVQWCYGYGENLIDYNHKNNRIGVGVLISDWL